MLADSLLLTWKFPHFLGFDNGPFGNFKFLGWQHATADLGKIIEVGIEGIKDRIYKSLAKFADDEDKTDFLNACLMMCDGIIAWENKCAE